MISTQNGHGPVAQFCEKKAQVIKEIFLLHDNDHFDLIATMAGFHMSNLSSTSCGNDYDHKDRHNRGGVCHLYYRFNDECVESTPHAW